MKSVEGLNSVLTVDVNLVAGIADLGVYVSMIEINIDVKNAKDWMQICKDCPGSQICEHKKQKYHCKECKAIEIQRYLQMLSTKECKT